MYLNQAFGSASNLFSDIDNKNTGHNVAEMIKKIDTPLAIAKGTFNAKKQPMSVFVARQLIAEVKRAIRVVGDKDKLLGEILDFVFFEKKSNNQTDICFYTSHNITDNVYYKQRKKALVMFAKEFNAGELLAFKNDKELK